MAKFCGKDFLIQAGDGGDPEDFTTIAYMTSTSMTLNNEQVDVTTKTDMPWRALAACGVQSMSVSLSGVFTDDATHVQAQQDAFDDVIKNYTLISGAGDSFSGAFQIASIERSGEHNNAEQFSMSLESAGTITYTPAP